MFIPTFVIHIVAGIIFVATVWAWALKTEGDYDFTPAFKLPITALGYAIFWIAFLALNKGCAA